jgi:hypothetical protein
LITTATSTAPTVTKAWAGAHIKYEFVQTDQMNKLIMLDNQSSVTIFSKKDLVENIRDTQDFC